MDEASRTRVPDLLAAEDDVTVCEAVKEFLIDCRIRNLRPRSIEWYEERLRAVLQPYWDAPLSAVDVTAIREMTARLMDGRSVATVNGYLRSVKALLNWALVEGIRIGVDPRRVRSLKTPKRIKPILTEEQIQRILQMPNHERFAGRRDYVVLLVLFDTGIRNGELCGLDVSDVDLPVIRVTGKGDKMRLTALSPMVQKETLRFLRDRRKRFGPEGPLFPNAVNGDRLNRHRVREIVRGYGEAAGIEFAIYPHACRYAFATHYLRNGGQVERLMVSLGHTSITMSLHYARMADVDALSDSMEFSPIAKLNGPDRETNPSGRRRR